MLKFSSMRGHSLSFVVLKITRLVQKDLITRVGIRIYEQTSWIFFFLAGLMWEHEATLRPDVPVAMAAIKSSTSSENRKSKLGHFEGKTTLV